jgi:polar amino acid transport system substrate-binding protein
LKKGVCALSAAMMAMSLGAVAYSQTSFSSAAPAQGERSALRVAVFLAPPSVMEVNGSLTGFSIDLWNAIASQLKLRTSYQVEPDVRALEEVMRSKNADLSLGVFITSARDAVFDFSITTMEAGLQIIVLSSSEKAQTESPLWDMLGLIFSQTTLKWLGMGLLLVLIPAHLVWFFERRNKDGIVSSRSYFPGIFEAIYWALSTLTTQAEAMPRQWVGRALSIFWMFVGVVFVAFYTAQLTTAMTVKQIRGGIEGPEDLPGKPVATLAGSNAVKYLREHHAQVQEFPTTDQMFEALLNKKVDAVVSAAPLLRYFAAQDGKGRVKVVGPEFNSAPVAIMFQVDSPLRRKVDGAVATLRDNGTYQQLFDKWFGNP